MQSFADLVATLRPGAEVFVAGCAGESGAFIDALRNQPERARGVRFTGVLIPGVNRFDYAGLHPEARVRVIFVNPEFRQAMANGQLEYLPLTYSGMARFIETARIDLCVTQAASGPKGSANLSLCNDFAPILLARGVPFAVEFNAALPRTNGTEVPRAQIVASVRSEASLFSYDAGPIEPEMQAVARNVRRLVDDGSTLQFGLGKLQKAVLGELHDARRLRVHSGMISSPLLPLLHTGVIDPSHVLCAGVALGDDTFYRAITGLQQLRFRPVNHTHAHDVLSQIEGLISVNAFIEMDLTGQVNAEAIGARHISGGGGLLDFHRGAAAAPGGRGILAMPARAGTRSRIVPRLAIGTPVTVSRNDVDTVVSDHGIAELAGKSLHERAEALMQLAAPEDRDWLARAWHEIRKEL